MGTDALRKVGGVILQQEEIRTRPAQEHEPQHVSVSLMQDGRVSVKVGDLSFTATVEPWMLKPLVAIAESGQPSLVSLLGEAISDEEIRWEEEVSSKHNATAFFIEVHPALLDTLLGMQLLLADIALVGNDSFDEVRRVQNLLKEDNPLLMVGAARPTPEGDSVVFWNPPWAISASREATIQLSRIDWDGYVIADDTVNYSLSVTERVAAVDGAPFHHFWQDVPRARMLFRDGKVILIDDFDPVLLDEFNSVCRETGWALMAASPEIWDTVRRAGFWLAVFRQVKREEPAAWREFSNAVRALPDPPMIETPRAWIR
jgi:hypothetical protein